MEEEKRGPGRPVGSGQKFRMVRYVQMHDAFTPLQMAPIMSLGKEGAKAMEILEERPHGVYVKHPKGREFIVPYGNISFYELDLEHVK